MTERTDALKSMHTSLIEARNGYDEAVKQSEGKGLTPLVLELVSLHSAAASAIATHLTALGETPEADGSFMSTVHRTVIDLRSYVTGLDENILPSLISGEERNLATYDETIEATKADAPEYATLNAQRDTLAAKIEQMEAMKSRFAA